MGCHFLLQCMKVKSESEAAQSCPTLSDPMDCSTLGFDVHHQLSELAQTHAIQPSHLCRPLLLLPPIFPSIRVFSSESVVCIRWPKYLSFSFSISPANEYSGLISFSMNSLDLLAVQGTLKSLLQRHSSKTSILGHSVLLPGKSHGWRSLVGCSPWGR